MSRLAGLISRRPWRIVGLAIAFLVVAVLVGGPLTANLTSAGFEDPNAEFVAARDRLEAATGANPNPGIIALVEAGSDVRSGAGRAQVEKAAATIAADPDVAQVVTAYNGGGDALISNDGDRVVHRGLPEAHQRRRGRRTPPCASATSSRPSRASRSAAPSSWARRSARSSARTSPRPS